MPNETGTICLVGGERSLTQGEIALVQQIFGTVINCNPVRIKRSKWFPFQPRQTVMAPRGHLHFHPATTLYSDDFSAEGLNLQGLFLHEMTHVWQVQSKGEWHLVTSILPIRLRLETRMDARTLWDRTAGRNYPPCLSSTQRAQIARYWRFYNL